ncbi:MAG TPA: hypothetical protein VE957_05985 [Terriglobales bacterium]|nr:hypothetical protein [Terriglobales bacterium]
MLLLFASAAVFEAKNLSSLSALSNGDIWWHLRTGIWIIQNHGVPHSGLFSQSPQLPWTASSWGYDLLVAFAFRMLDLRSIPLLLMVFKLAFAVVTFFLAGGLCGRFWPAVALSVIAQYILGRVQPVPSYCSMLFFAVELVLLNENRDTGNVRPLFWLPPLFLAWANLDIQFVYGILLLLLFLTASLLPDLVRRSGVAGLQQKSATVSPANAGIVATLCGIATLITPYSYHLYGAFFSSVTSAANRYFPDHRAMSFRQPQDYVLLLLTMGAFLALGLRRSHDPFQILLMIGCAMLSFHAERDAWLAALAAIAVIAEAVRDRGGTADADHKRTWNQHVLIAGGLSLTILFLAAAFEIPRSHEELVAKTAQTYPVAACNYIREHQLPQPLFNSYEWGGFLTWYLPEYPVAIDGRVGLYDDDFIVQYSKVMNADVPYQSYPALAQAGTLLLQRNSLMGQALSTLPRFKVAYRDDVAVVLTRP